MSAGSLVLNCLFEEVFAGKVSVLRLEVSVLELDVSVLELGSACFCLL